MILLTQVQQLQQPSPPPTDNLFYKSQALSLRIGEIEKLHSTRVSQPNRFLFILPLKQNEQLCKIQCLVVSSPTQHNLLNVPIFASDTMKPDLKNAPIFDRHDISSDRQIMHKFVVKSNAKNQEDQLYTIKAYPFNNYHDCILKNGLYEAALYRTLESYTRSQIIKDVFIIENGVPSALVFVYGPFLFSLQDILMYRLQFSMFYTEAEQLYIANQILSKYKTLLDNNITHRDIRPSKIYLSSSPLQSKPSSAPPLGYELLNLQSARKLSAEQMRRYEFNQDDSMLMTVRGVPMYCSPTVLEYHLRKQQVGMYDPWSNDRIQLAKTLAMVVTLDTSVQDIKYKEIKKKNVIMHGLITQLQNMNLSLRNVIGDFQENCRLRVPRCTGILQSDHKICKNSLSNFIKFPNSQRIQHSKTQLFFYLHLEQLINQRIQKIMEDNLKQNKCYRNVAVLDRMGKYYEGMKITTHCYYKQEMTLLLCLTEDARKRCVPNDELLEEAGRLYRDKFNGKISDPVISINYKIQRAFHALGKDDFLGATQLVAKAFQEGVSSIIPFSTQIKLIQAKGVIEGEGGNLDSGNFYLQKGLDLSCDRRSPSAPKAMLEPTSNFQYLLAKNIITKAIMNRAAMTPEQLTQELGKCESLLARAKETRLAILTKNPVPLGNVNEALGDLCLLREDAQGARNYYEQVSTLYTNGGDQIGVQEKLRFLDKLLEFYKQHSDDHADQKRVMALITAIKNNSFTKINTQKSDGRLFNRPKSVKQQQKARIFERTNRNTFIDEIIEVEEIENSVYRAPPSSQQSYTGKQQKTLVDYSLASSGVQTSQKVQSNPKESTQTKMQRKLQSSSLNQNIADLVGPDRPTKPIQNLQLSQSLNQQSDTSVGNQQ